MLRTYNVCRFIRHRGCPVAREMQAIPAVLLVVAGCAASGRFSEDIPPAMAAVHPAPAVAKAQSLRPARVPLSVPPGLLVAHALGGIGGMPYTNSLDALRCNYARGFRWFEVDLALTKDGELVCFHPGNEQIAGLPRPVAELPVAEVAGQRYGGRYPIPRFSELLNASDALGGVVLVTDTKGWSPPMVDALRRALQARRTQPTRVVFQSYGEQDIQRVSELAREVGSDIILTLYMSPADDVRVESLARQFNVLAIVADTRRFTPWLAGRLHEASVPILVHTVNDHREILSFIRAGADGFYTDAYRPYESSALKRSVAADCDAPLAPGLAWAQWAERDVATPGDYIVQPCVRRSARGFELAACDQQAAIIGPFMSVPPGRVVHLTLEVEADADGSDFWLDVLQKNGAGPLQARQNVSLTPGQVSRFDQRYDLSNGSPGIDVRLGLQTAGDGLIVRALKMTLEDGAPVAGVTAAAASGPEGTVP